MSPVSWRSHIYTLVRIGLALSFLVAGMIKIQDPMTFAVTIDAFGILPGSLALPMAILLLVLEIIGALALMFDIRGSLGLIACMLLCFVVVLGYGLQMGLDIDCGCYGPGDPEGIAFAGIRSALWRDAFMLACVVALYVGRMVLDVRPDSLSTKIVTIKTFITKEEAV